MGFGSCGTQAQWLWCTGLVAPRHVDSCRTRDWTPVPCTGTWILIHSTTREVHFSCILSPHTQWNLIWIFHSISTNLFLLYVSVMLICYGALKSILIHSKASRSLLVFNISSHKKFLPYCNALILLVKHCFIHIHTHTHRLVFFYVFIFCCTGCSLLCEGFLLQWAGVTLCFVLVLGLLIVMASLVAEHRLWAHRHWRLRHKGSVVSVHGLQSSGSVVAALRLSQGL